ncbi:MAG: DegT/DnrJ/EryC1/StrS family aminotransferase [Bacteroidota bacterium]
MSIRYPVYQPNIGEEEKANVLECLDSTWISSKGKFITQFEEDFARIQSSKYAISVCNGTVALHVALLALGIGPGDEVLVPSFTYIASVNAIAYTGAKPVFVDITEDGLLINPREISKHINQRTKAIMAVHLYGDSCDMHMISEIAIKHGLFIIEDCAEALGTKFNNQPVGTFGHISTFSFFGNKTITTGEGGMITTNDSKLYNLARRLKGQGLADGMEYWHDILGYNYRMTNICAAIGVAQIKKIDQNISKKRALAFQYFDELQDLNIQLPRKSKEVFHTYWMFNILLENEEIRKALREYLIQKGIETRPSFYPAHQMPMYNGQKDLDLPVTESISSRGINLPSYPELGKEDISFISEQIHSFYRS